MKQRPLILLATLAVAFLIPGSVATASAQASAGSTGPARAASTSSSTKMKFRWTFQGQADNTAESAWASEHRKFGDLVRTATNGQVDITYVSGVCPDTQVLDAVKAKQLDIGTMGVHYKPEMALMNFPSLPIVPNNRLPEILALLKPQFDAIWQKQWGVKLLAFSYYLPQMLYTAKPADTLEGLKEHKIRQFGADVIELYTRAGGTPVNISNIHLVQENLVEGRIDGAQGALPAYVNWGWAQRLKYISNWPLGSVYMALVINLDDWNALPPDLQVKLVKAAQELERNQWNGRQTYVDQLIEQAGTKYGSKVVNPPQPEVDKLLVNIDPVLEDWKKKVGPDSATILEVINKVLGTQYK
jgi:TRAP-type C4-dicarboxylate transport system substrate-binding protein